MNDGALKNNTTYWAEITDKDLKELFGKQLQLKFTGIFFRGVEQPKQIYYLSQIKIFREINPSETVGTQ